MIQDSRVHLYNDRQAVDRDYVLYWMQASQRTEYNHALRYAVRLANERGKPVVVGFGLTDDYPAANLRHYHFMLQGLSDVKASLEKEGIEFVVRLGRPDKIAIELAGNADLVVADAGYLDFQLQWRHNVAEKIDCPFYEVETNVVVPVGRASDKHEFAARTIRPKITKQLDDFLIKLTETKTKVSGGKLNLRSVEIDPIEKLLANLKVDRSVKPSQFFIGGNSHAKKHLKNFIENKLANYENDRNDPNKDGLSNMSPYLHFGQISPLYIALQIKNASKSSSAAAYLEELIVRRELAINNVYYSSDYANFEGLPPWAKTTLNFHGRDKREHIYTMEQFEKGQTADPYWNASQMEMVITGKMHGYMRMYWGKKILEWSESPAKAIETALYLNDKYEIDGRDSNGYTNVLWCFGLHDRAWKERPIFGKIRYMSDEGLNRKFDAGGYVKKIDDLKSKGK